MAISVVPYYFISQSKEDKLKEIARTAEKIKSASQAKIKTVQDRADKVENELNLTKERNFNLETQILLLKDDQRNFETLRIQYRKLRNVIFTHYLTLGSL